MNKKLSRVEPSVPVTMTDVADHKKQFDGSLAVMTDIMEQKQIEKALSESRELFSSAFHASPDAIAITRFDDGRMIDANEAYELLLGRSRSESVGRTTAELSIWADPADRITFIKKLTAFGAIDEFETKLRRKDGEIITVLDSARVINVQDQKCVISVLHDVTALEESEKMLTQAQTIAKIGSWKYDLATQKIDWSDETYVLYERDKKLGPPTEKEEAKYYSLSDSQHLHELASLIVDKKQEVSYEMPVKLPSGKKAFFITTMTPVMSPIGKVIQIMGTVQDITAKKLGIEQLAKLATFSELNPGPIVEFTVSGTVQYTNIVAKHLFPDLEQLGFKHPFLLNIEESFSKIKNKQDTVTRDVLVNDRWFRQVLMKVSETKAYRVYASEITDRKNVEMEREQFFTFFNLSTDIMVIADPNGAFKKVNPTCLSVLGYSEAELLAKPFIDFVYPEDKQSTLNEMAQQIQVGASLNFENHYVCKDGKVLWLSWRANYDKEDGVTYATARDITEQKNAEAELKRINRSLRTVSDINQVLVRATDETGLLQETCRIAVEESGYQLAWVGFAEQDESKTVRCVAQAGPGEKYLQSIEVSWADSPLGQGPTGTAIRLGKTQIANDIATDPYMGPWRESALKNGLKSSISLPLLSNGKTFGALTVYGMYANVFHASDVKILEELAGDLAFGIVTVRARMEHEQMERQIEKNNTDLKEAQRIGTFGNFDWSAKTDQIVWSEEYYHIYGIDPSQKPPGYEEHLKIYSPESAKKLDEAVKQSMTIGKPYEVDLEHKFPDGTWKWVTARGEVKLDENKKIVGLRGTAQDITERKHAEKELARVNRTLYMLSAINQSLIKITNEQELLDKICEIIVAMGGYRLMWIGFAEYDEAKSVLPVAQAGFGTDYLKSAKITWADDEHGRGPTGVAIRTQKTQIARDILKDPIMTPWKEAAEKRGYKSSIALPLTSEGQTFGALNIYANEDDAFGEKEVMILEELAGDLAFGIATIRRRKLIEERTQEVNQLKNKFISIVSHQLRTPLTIIRWCLGAVLNKERGEVTASQEETLREAYTADLDVISRVDDLLIAVEIEEKHIRLETEKMDITGLFQSVSEEKLQPCQLKNITYTIIPPSTPLPEVQVDAEKIRYVLMQIIDNAITYSNGGGKIEVKFFTKEKNVRFEISDTGVGIPVSEQPRIFERFHRGWNAAQMKPDASGLGLYISKQYILAHQGTIGFTSVEKKGSTFWFELPVA